MKTLLYLLVPVAWLWLASKDLIFGTLAFLILAGVGYYIVWRIQKQKRIIAARERIEPVFVLCINSETGDTVPLPDNLEKLCIHADHCDAVKVAKEEMAFLESAGNEFMKEEDPENRLPIRVILFRDGIYVNETWFEYCIRSISEIRETRSNWHGRMKEADQSWYLKWHHGQRVIEW